VAWLNIAWRGVIVEVYFKVLWLDENVIAVDQVVGKGQVR